MTYNSIIGIFSFATAFNQDISEWDTSKVSRMWGMFSEAASFKQDISEWNVSNVNHSEEFADGTGLNKSDLPKFTH